MLAHCYDEAASIMLFDVLWRREAALLLYHTRELQHDPQRGRDCKEEVAEANPKRTVKQ